MSEAEVAGQQREDQRFALWLKAEGLARRTQQTYVDEARWFRRWLEERGVVLERLSDAERLDVVTAYRDDLVSQGRPGSSVNLARSAVSAYCRSLRLVAPAVGPVEVVRPDPVVLAGVTRSRALDCAQARGVLERAVFAGILGTGLRKSEVANLDVDDVVTNGHEGYVLAPAPDGGKRVIPLDGGTAEVLLAWRAQRAEMLDKQRRRAFFLGRTRARLLDDRVDAIVRAVGEEIGLVLSPQVLRDTYEASLWAAQLNEEAVNYLMGRGYSNPHKRRTLAAVGVAPCTRTRTRQPSQLTLPF